MNKPGMTEFSYHFVLSLYLTQLHTKAIYVDLEDALFSNDRMEMFFLYHFHI